MSITYNKIPNFPFYSLNQFTQLQPLSPKIYLYQHNQSHQIFVIKEVPYKEQSLIIYETVMNLHSMESIVRLKGLCKMVVKFQKNGKNSINMKMKKEQDQASQQTIFQNKRGEMCMEEKNNRGNEKNDADKNKNTKDKNQKGKEKNNKKHQNQEEYILLFMQKCQQNLVQYIRQRRKQRKPFKSQQITNFISNTLLLLERLQKQNISHRDIKPQNFLYDKGKFKLCDFDDSLYFDPSLSIEQRQQLNLTTIEYTSPQFFRNLKQNKQKIFDPYKLDVYSLGITIIYMCSMGNFNLEERRRYLVYDSLYHNNYMKQQRRKYLKNNQQYKNLNTIVKMMLEEDEYKRDTFITLLMKMKPIMDIRDLQINVIEDQTMTISEKTKSEESQKKLKNGQKKSKNKGKKKSWEGNTEKQRKSLKILVVLAFAFFILLLFI